MVSLQSYRIGSYLMVVGSTGKTIVHFGTTAGPIVHQDDNFGRALSWVEAANREDDAEHRGVVR